MIPGLEKAEYARYGVMHRNTYLNGPDVLGDNFALKTDPLIRFAGQMTGVEGYMESAASGLLAGVMLSRRLRGLSEPTLPGTTMLGALVRHTTTKTSDYQPMNANFGILEPLGERVRVKRLRYERLSARAIDTLNEVIQKNEL